MNTVICIHLILDVLHKHLLLIATESTGSFRSRLSIFVYVGGDPERRETWYNPPLQITYLNLTQEISENKEFMENSSY